MQTSINSAAQSRHERFRDFVAADPGNARLLADAAEAAIAARAFDDADRYIGAGVAAEGATPAWRFREATLRIAQRRLADARALLNSLRSEGAIHAAVDHNLAYIDFLEGDYAGCAAQLHAWVSKRDGTPAVVALWLRALHHLGRLPEAWAWIDRHGVAGLDAAGTGVAALIALDHDEWAAAGRFAAAALAKDPAQAEARLVQGVLLLGRHDLEGARRVFAAVVHDQPHQPRGWSLLGYTGLLEGKGEEARRHFEQSLALLPGDESTQVGLGWACIVQGDLAAAAAAFGQVLANDDSSADAHGGLAVALALQGRRQEAAAHAERARRLQPGHLAARYADAIVSGRAEGVRGAQRLVAQLFGVPPKRT